MTRVVCSVTVGDAAPESDLAECVHDLNHQTHVGLEARVGHRVKGCGYDAFAAESAPDGILDGGRPEFEASMRRFSLEDAIVAGHLAEWDRAQRPIAIVHAIEVDRL